jgi:hypothetical protein
MCIKNEVERIEEIKQAIRNQFASAVVAFNGLSMAAESASLTPQFQGYL